MAGTLTRALTGTLYRVAQLNSHCIRNRLGELGGGAVRQSDKPSFASSFGHLVVVKTWMNYLTSLSLNFHRKTIMFKFVLQDVSRY